MTEKTVRRVPKLYKEAGKVLQKVREDGGSVKTLVYGAKHPNLKALYALVLETLKHGQQLDYLVRKTQILSDNPKLNPWITRVLMTELLWQKKVLSAVSPPQEIVQSYHEKFLSELANIPTEETTEDPSDSPNAAPNVRYVRVNTLKDTTETVVKWFKEIGWQELVVRANKKDLQQKMETISSNQFFRDIDVPDLLVFPHSFRFYDTDLFKEGVILLQDKASCIPPLLLDPPPGSVVVDMCAAPGMKTTQIAAILGNKGVVYAVEINERRYATLCATVEKSGATCVKTINGDVLHHSSKDLKDVEYIILDPPCSGSGMLSRKSIFGEAGMKDPQRLAKLANFQCSLLRHAMTNFPKVKRIVYSTCSIHPEENEGVIESVLRNSPPNFVPLRSPPHTAWMTKGSTDYEHGSCGFYSYPKTHFTNGFFVAVFERSEHEYECVSKPLSKRGSLNEAIPCDDSNETKKKKKKKSERAQKNESEEVNGDNDEGSRKRKSDQPYDAVQKMLKAMQKTSTTQNSEVDNGEDGQEIKKKKKMKSKRIKTETKDETE